MNSDLDKTLCEKYPKIFRDRYADMRTTAMCWGFDCGDGWYNIIRVMCANMQNHIDHSRKNRLNALRYNRALKRAINGDDRALIKYYSWGLSEKSKEWAIKNAERDMANPKFRDVPVACPQVVASQVKEKFGTLRFYYGGGDSYCRGVESMADAMSAVTCETCGNPGKMRRGGWIRTLCDEHAEQAGYTDELEDSDETEGC
jgi:hypothetical protein